ncbi:MAG: hypothetical protein AAF960_24270 [Bacteroidota bacterium]
MGLSSVWGSISSLVQNIYHLSLIIHRKVTTSILENKYLWRFLLVSILSCFWGNLTIAQKIKGMSISGPKTPSFKVTMFEAIKTSGSNWVALIPEATIDRTTLLLKSDADNDWWSETVAANIEGIRLAKAAGFKVFLKPHVVLSERLDKKRSYRAVQVANKKRLKDKTGKATWRGDLAPKNETDWQTFEASYEAYILRLAEIAEELNVELFSVGTELKQSAWRRPAFWQQLIRKVRAIYSGQLVYAANWDEYQKITFWKELDYIGVDTYFPVNRMATPNIKKTVKNWRPIQRQMRKFSKQHNRQVLLTEFGYRSVSHAGKRPWTHDKGYAVINNQAQHNLYEAFFQTFWGKKWIAGGFAWKWFVLPKPTRNSTFSMQQKPAMEVLQAWYALND